VTLGLQGTERDPIRLMALILNHAYLTPDDVDLKLGEPKAEEGGKVWTLPVTGKGMAPFDLSFDAKSWQLIRASSRTAAGRLTLAFEDFRKASDLQVAYKVTRTLSRDGVDDTTLFTVQKVDRKAELEEGVFERPSEPTRAFKLPEGKTSEAVPVQVHPTHHLLVQVSIDGGEATPFLLDSAAPMSLIDATLAKKLGLKTAERIVDRHASGPRTYDVFPVQRLAVGGLELQKTVVGSADLSGLAKELSLPLGGILGMDALDRLVVELKYGAGTATFHDPGSYADPGTGEALPIDDFGRVNALINGQTLLSVVLDTGSGAAIDIPPALARKEKLEPPAEKRLPVAVAGPGNPKPAWLGQLESVQLGQLSVPRVVTVFQEPAGDAAKDQEAVAVVGNQLLERFNVTFDLPRRQVILEQGPWFSRPFAYDRSGLRFKAGSERVIEAVAEGTTADLKPGDQVVGVMTEKGLSKDSGVIEARFREPAGTKLTLKIRRGQLEQDRELVLRELLN
jgi:predicted aspartyl protease